MCVGTKGLNGIVCSIWHVGTVEGRCKWPEGVCSCWVNGWTAASAGNCIIQFNRDCSAGQSEIDKESAREREIEGVSWQGNLRLYTICKPQQTVGQSGYVCVGGLMVWAWLRLKDLRAIHSSRPQLQPTMKIAKCKCCCCCCCCAGRKPAYVCISIGSSQINVIIKL